MTKHVIRALLLAVPVLGLLALLLGPVPAPPAADAAKPPTKTPAPATASPTRTATPQSATATPIATATPAGPTATPGGASRYDSLILSRGPVGYWPLAPGVTSDASGHGLHGTFTGGPAGTTMPDGSAAPVFNGVDQYFTVQDSDWLEITRTGVLTVEAWLRPDVLTFPGAQTSGDGPYVHWMGKGVTGQHSWAARIYDKDGSTRPNRISGYAFNLTGGLGAGSYFQDALTAGQWIHYTLVVNTVNTSSTYPTGYTKIFKNGVQRDQDKLSDYDIVPGNGTAPVRVATRDLASFFLGAIGKVAMYDYELTPAQLAEHYQAMTTP